MALPQQKSYTVKDIYALPDGQRAELIDGQIYDYIKSRNGSCLVYPPPFAVFLNKDDRNYVEPDISVICDKNKLDDKGCNGSPGILDY